MHQMHVDPESIVMHMIFSSCGPCSVTRPSPSIHSSVRTIVLTTSLLSSFFTSGAWRQVGPSDDQQPPQDEPADRAGRHGRGPHTHDCKA